MILFSLEEIFNLSHSPQCEDIGIQGLRTVKNEWWISALFIFFISFTLSSTDNLILKYVRIP